MGAKLTAEQRRAMLTSLAAKRKNASAAPSADPRAARPTTKTSQEGVDDIDETKEVTEEITEDEAKEAKRFARKLKRRAHKVAQEEHAEEIETIVEDEDEDVADDVADAVAEEAAEAIVNAVPEAAALPEEELAEIIEDAVENAVEAAVKRSAAKKKLARKARVASRKKADTADGEVSDDLVKDEPAHAEMPQKDTATEVAVSDDLEEKSIAPDGTTKENGEGVKPPASVEAAKSKFIAALDLVKTEKAAGILAPNAREAAVCDEYAGKYSVEAMKLATEKLRAIGSAQRVAGVSPARHIAANASTKKTASTGSADFGALY